MLAGDVDDGGRHPVHRPCVGPQPGRVSLLTLVLPVRWAVSYGVWAAWILLFVALELPGWFRWSPWVTLSETSWHAEATYWPVRVLLFGFLIGLVTHIVFHGAMWRTQMLGLVVSLAAHLVDKHWP